MRKVICLIAISFMLISTCQASTITWKESEVDDIASKPIEISENVFEKKTVNLKYLAHELQQFEARIEHLEMLKSEKEAEIALVESTLQVVKVDGVYTTSVVAIEK